MGRASGFRPGPGYDVSPPDRQCLARRDLQFRMQIHLTFGEAVNLHADESPRVTLVNLFVREIFDEIAVDPRLNARPARDDAEPVPPVVDEMMMSFVDLLLRRQPVRSHGLAVEQAGCRLAF